MAAFSNILAGLGTALSIKSGSDAVRSSKQQLKQQNEAQKKKEEVAREAARQSTQVADVGEANVVLGTPDTDDLIESPTTETADAIKRKKRTNTVGGLGNRNGVLGRVGGLL